MYVIAITDGHHVTIFGRHVAAIESVRGVDDQCVVLMVDGTRYHAARPMTEVAEAVAALLKAA